MDNLFDFVCKCGCDIEFAKPKTEELEAIIDERVEKESQRLAEKKINDMKENFYVETVKKVNEENVRKEGEELSRSSPYIT